ncbi:MAG: hypothetical protein Q4Q25_03730 [Methanocorpusculum sp.]|nr:hypothetical protein [Methanocorpusculum sp.]
MTEVKFYVPDEKISSVNAFRIIHGKSWGHRLLEFIEREIAAEEENTKNTSADTLYKKYFGDIAAERSFISSMNEDICFAENALTNRLRTVRKTYPDKYQEIYTIFKNMFPIITKRMEDAA